jgi:iron complex outermembrane receptor protein
MVGWKQFGAGTGALATALSMLGGNEVTAQTQLPEVVVTAPSPIAARRRVAAPVVPVRAARRTAARRPSAPPPIARPPAAAPPVQTAQAPEPGTLPIVIDQFATVTVVPSDEIQRDPGGRSGQVGDLLFSKPGITASTFAPGGASRPIIRGLDNYRVRIQENGLAVNDVSDLSEDHGVPIDPLAARQIEVIRGPATLRWGSQAIGGVVDVSNNRIPTAIPARGLEIETKTAYTLVDNGREGGVLVDAGKGNFAFHADAYGRRADDYRIPSYPYLFPPDPAPPVSERQPNSFVRSNGNAVGGSYVSNQGFVGVAVSQFNSLYGIPGIEASASNTRIDLAQTKVTSKGEFRPEYSFVEAVRFWLGATDYKHNELGIGPDGFEGIQQTFTNKGQEGRLEVQLVPVDLRFAALTTAFGVQASHQDLAAPGVSGGLFDPNQMTSAAGFVFNEFKFNPTSRMQVAGRIESVTAKGAGFEFPPEFLPPPDEPAASAATRHFMPKSAAVGFLQDLPWNLVASVTAQYVERAPRTPELFSRGAHDATATFEIGNPDLKIESAKTVEIGLRRAVGPVRFEATAYYTRFDDFIFKRLTGVQCGDNFASCGIETELNQIVYSQRDAIFRGGEFQSQIDMLPLWGGTFGIENQFDTVRATFLDGSNVPRIPAVRAGGGVFWRDAAWFARVNLLHAFPHTEIAEHETPTDGYNLLKAELSYTKKLRPDGFSPTSVTYGITGNNLLNEDIRNSASFKKDEVLLPGRNFRLFATIRF